MTEIKRSIRRFHPGVYVKDALDALNMSSKEFSIRTGISERTLSDLINEKGNITFDIATKLSDFFGNSVNGWTNLQNAYDQYIEETKAKEELESDYLLLKPYKKYLISNNFINENDSNENVVLKVRTLLKVNNLSLLNSEELLVSFKEQNTYFKEGTCFAQNLWLSYALTKARGIETSPFNKKKVFECIYYLKKLMFKKPKDFYYELVNLLKSFGISFVYVPYLNQSYIFGATKWLSNDKVMLSISNKNERADIFWFTFFHEIVHVLKEHKRYCLLQIDNKEDIEADSLASDILIPNEMWVSFIEKKPISQQTINALAKEAEVPTFVVIGKLLKENRISYSNDLYKNNMVFYKKEDFDLLI